MAAFEWDRLRQPMQKLAEGGFCSIYSTSCENTGDGDGQIVGDGEIVVKTTTTASPLAVADLRREQELLTCMAPHENVMRLLGHGSHPLTGLPFIVLPLISGLDLPGPRESTSIWSRRSAVKRWHALRACRVASELADALDHCHHRAIPGSRLLHRDVKPRNLGLDASDRLVLFDFGLAARWQVAEGDEEASKQRLLTAYTGSLRYMAPEVMVGADGGSKALYNHKCDVYSWAVLTWQLLAHALPYSELACFGPMEVMKRCREVSHTPRHARHASHTHPSLRAGTPTMPHSTSVSTVPFLAH